MGLRDVANSLLLLGACGIGGAQIVYSNDRAWAWTLGLGVACLVVGAILELVVRRDAAGS